MLKVQFAHESRATKVTVRYIIGNEYSYLVHTIKKTESCAYSAFPKIKPREGLELLSSHSQDKVGQGEDGGMDDRNLNPGSTFESHRRRR